MPLATRYLGLYLRSPFIVGSSPLCDDLGIARQLQDAGAGAVVMRSLFMEQFGTGPALGSDRALAALREADIAFDPALLAEGDLHETGGVAAIDTLFAAGGHFSAIFAANDLTAYGARLGLYRRAIRVPEEMSLVGFDDLPGSAFTTPPLTTVRQPLYEMGKIASGALPALINGERVAATLPPLALVVRETTRKLV